MNGLQRFAEEFGKEPTTPPREFIPPRWRWPVFIAMVVVGVLGLVLLWTLVVGPAMRSPRSGAPGAPAPATAPSGAAQ